MKLVQWWASITYPYPVAPPFESDETNCPTADDDPTAFSSNCTSETIMLSARTLPQLVQTRKFMLSCKDSFWWHFMLTLIASSAVDLDVIAVAVAALPHLVFRLLFTFLKFQFRSISTFEHQFLFGWRCNRTWIMQWSYCCCYMCVIRCLTYRFIQFRWLNLNYYNIL